MRALRFAAALAAALLLQLIGTRLLPAFPMAADLPLVAVVLHALDGNTLAGLLTGMTAGLFTDVLSGGVYGVHGVADTVIGYGTAFAAQRLVIRRAPAVFLTLVLASLSQHAVLIGVTLTLLPDPAVPSFPWILVRAGTTGVIGVILGFASRRLSRRLESWRRGRYQKVRLDR